ncbi:hypothetical protein K2173_010462 [Erythroxylum novogranatense]|uniref:U6 small nuclear RNA (adenine-(43)-N(6))-methyltransferase n=1 Tax=Erythroxylum novogranatense TaxID=1862640 RepID=A0AAV8TDQ5_9ROSI|nr:hypothetical protein K2173_010462 [Erythroxylum novogranatense]
MPSKKNKRKRPDLRPTIHPRNKYADKPPDFTLLASLYPSFKTFVFYSRDGRPRIDWTDFNATRELTRVLLLHDHDLNWWIPDGQLCPTVPNRSNYIHWIEDLLSSDIIPKNNVNGNVVRGFDIGTGANCIYPLLGASLLGWSFVGSDITDVALEWAERNVKDNPQISELIEIRKVSSKQAPNSVEQNGESAMSDSKLDVSCNLIECREEPLSSPSFALPTDMHTNYSGPPILLGVVRDYEKFDFCMCNPPFFESMEEAGLNPKTSCGGTPEEMVCTGGEKAFINQLIEDSVILKESFRWYTSMVGRKTNLKFLTSKLREVGVTIVKTTEFIQGQTCRWGLAWSFVHPARKIISPPVAEKSILSFTLEGLQHQSSAMDVLLSVESFFLTCGASCRLNTSSFTVDIKASNDQCDTIVKNEAQGLGNKPLEYTFNSSVGDLLCFRISVFQQIPGTLLVKASLQHRDGPLSGLFSSIVQQMEEYLTSKFCRRKAKPR